MIETLTNAKGWRLVKRIVVASLFFIFLSACTLTTNNDINGKSEELMLKDIAYDNRSNYSNTVYIQEEESFEPYIVISKNYNNGVLLLREYLLDDEICFSAEKSYGSCGGYYPISNVDNYLTSVFLQKLPPELRQQVLETSIKVASLDSVSTGGRGVESVKRRVFLLSAKELGIKSFVASKEGNRLSYFNDSANWIAVNSSGDARNYWLRSAFLGDDIQAWVIACDGKYGGSRVSAPLALRPAFCLSSDTKIERKEGVVGNEAVYVLKMD